MKKDSGFCHKSESFFVITYVGAKASGVSCFLMKLGLLKKLLAACLCLTLFLSTPIHSYATESEMSASPRYTYISDYHMSLSVSDATAHIYADLTSKDFSQNCYIKCNLEKLMGTYWMQMKSFETNGIGGIAMGVDHPIDRGTYRVMGTFRINNEIQTAYTGNKTY